MNIWGKCFWLFWLFILGSCGNDDQEAGFSLGSGRMSVTIAGQMQEIRHVAALEVEVLGQFDTVRQVSISGDLSEKGSFYISLASDIGLGSYSLSKLGIPSVSYELGSGASYVTRSGTLEVTKNDPMTNTISGTFSGYFELFGSRQPLEVIEGQFEVKYARVPN